MRIETLPSPGLLSNGIRLRTEAAKAISAIEIQATFGSGKATYAKALSDFFTACAASISTFLDVTVPTVLTRAIDKSFANQLRIRHSEGLDPGFVPLPAAFTVAGVAKTVSKVQMDGPDVILTVTVPFVTGNAATVAYTQGAAAERLRDLSGNLVASYTAAAITNPL